MVKIILTDKTKKDIVSMYAQGVSIRDIARKHKFSVTFIKNTLKKMGFYRKGLKFYKKKCILCGNTYWTVSVKSKYCNNPCTSSYVDGSKSQDNCFKYHIIKVIRTEFWRLLKSNPKKAFEVEKQMEKEEGKEFRDMVLDGITESGDFNRMMDIYNKYEMVFNKGDVNKYGKKGRRNKG